MEEIIAKIQKLLNLADNNSNENEAIAAALKAQEMMAKYHIELDQLDSKKESHEITQEIYWASDKHDMKKWKAGFATIVANNFRCKTYFLNGKNVVFYGYKDDAKIALNVFKFLYEAGNKFAVRYYNQCKKEGKETRGVMNTYLIGFREGIASVLEKQCVALMVITPQEVKDSFAEMSAGWGKITSTIRASEDHEARERGRRDGKDIATARSIEMR